MDHDDPLNRTFRFRVVSYNIHKCRGLDRRVSPQRIISILHALDADILCLQEVVNAPGGSPLHDQAGVIRRALPDHHCVFGANRPLHGGTYGSMTLSRLPVLSHRNHDITHRREERGALQTDLQLPSGQILHLFNIHLGTMPHERHAQGQRLLSDAILQQPHLNGPRLVVGDFNEWTQGLTTRLLRSTFQSTRPTNGRFRHSFPGLLPLFTLDHCYFEPPLTLESTTLFRTRTSLIASDHLPLLANLTLPPDEPNAAPA